MSVSQKEAFKIGEADRWYERNASVLSEDREDIISTCIARLDLEPRRILEIGAANGWRLAQLQSRYGAKAAGIEPSQKAVNDGSNLYPGVDLQVGTAEQLPFEDANFDLVVLGFCLYLVDPALHFRAVSEADRVLKDGGILAILDFQTGIPYHNEYHHLKGINAFKMEFSRIFLAHPSYSLVHRELINKGEALAEIDNRIGVDFLMKDCVNAFPGNPYKK